MTNKPLKIRLKEQLENLGISFLELERQTGIKANRMYKWYQQDTNPKKEDADILEKWLNRGEISTNEIEEPQAEVVNYTQKTVFNLTESNRMLAESTREMVSMLHKVALLDEMKASLDKVPDSMTLLTDLLLKGQDYVVQQLSEKFAELQKQLSSAVVSKGKKTLQNQKR